MDFKYLESIQSDGPSFSDSVGGLLVFYLLSPDASRDPIAIRGQLSSLEGLGDAHVFDVSDSSFVAAPPVVTAD